MMFALNLLVHLLSLCLLQSSSLDETKENTKKGPTCRDLTGIHGITQHCCIMRSNVTETVHGISDYMKPKLPSISCLPTFIIAGTQKSGTTVLAALLNEHNAISFPAKKELHFFDRDAYYKKGMHAYLKVALNLLTPSLSLSLYIYIYIPSLSLSLTLPFFPAIFYT